ncbi:hypothetical protein Tco_0935049 [Tanacetum coccineum]
MSNSNTNLQTQSSNALHNAIMEAGSKDRPPMLAPVPVAEGSSETTTERKFTNLPTTTFELHQTPVRATQDNSPKSTEDTGKIIKRAVNVCWARENVEQADWKDDTDDESEEQELEAHYMYMAQIQEVTPDQVDNSGPIFDDEPMHKLVKIVLFIVDSGCSKHMTGNLKLLTNFVEKFLGTVKFGNDQIAPILGYGDLVQGTITIKRVYYVEGLNHNLFSVGQFCDADLEVAFQKSTCYIHDLKGNDLLTGSRGTNSFSNSLQDPTLPIQICLKAEATSSQAWL